MPVIIASDGDAELIKFIRETAMRVRAETGVKAVVYIGPRHLVPRQRVAMYGDLEIWAPILLKASR